MLTTSRVGTEREELPGARNASEWPRVWSKGIMPSLSIGTGARMLSATYRSLKPTLNLASSVQVPVMLRLFLTCIFTVAVGSLGSSLMGQNPSPAENEVGIGRPGRLDGVWEWTLPDTPNGLRPTQSWHATASSPDGDIYVGGMDHVTNAALYRLHWRESKLQLVGDARSASEAVANWLPGETAQKFHTRPLWHNGKLYVATMDRSTLATNT
jgi:hypothetical protein